MENKLKEVKGITLIALVITIIVLLILAGVSIATLTGENGILTRATNAKNKTKEAEADEIFKLIANEWKIEKAKGTSLEAFLEEKEEEYGIETPTADGDGYIIEYNGEKIKIDVNGTLTEVAENEEAATLVPGLYAEDGTMTYSWEELLNTEITYMEWEDEITSTILYVDGNGLNTNVYMVEGSEVNASSPYLVGKLIIDDSVTKMNWGFYLCENLTEVVLPNQMSTIESMIFGFCSKLSSITIPNSVTSIEYWAIYGCTNLREINYLGTQKEWNSITFGSDWNDSSPEIIVHCTDGDIVIPAYTE